MLTRRPIDIKMHERSAFALACVIITEMVAKDFGALNTS
jgi:hypothetical protein